MDASSWLPRLIGIRRRRGCAILYIHAAACWSRGRHAGQGRSRSCRKYGHLGQPAVPWTAATLGRSARSPIRGPQTALMRRV